MTALISVPAPRVSRYSCRFVESSTASAGVKLSAVGCPERPQVVAHRVDQRAELVDDLRLGMVLAEEVIEDVLLALRHVLERSPNRFA